MSKLELDLIDPSPTVLRAIIKLCQSLLNDQDNAARCVGSNGCGPELTDIHGAVAFANAISDAAVFGTDEDTPMTATEVAANKRATSGTGAVKVWTDEAQHLQQEHVDSLNVRMESREAGSPVGTVTTFNPPGLPAEFTLVNQPPVVIPPGLGAIGGGIELDTAGLPWDSRIHSSNKTKLANGTWRPKKGVDASVQTKVVKQIANEVTHVPPAPPAGTGMTWEILLQRIVAATQSGRINVVEFNQWLLDRNVQGGVAMLSLRNDLWNDVINTFGV